MQSPHELNAFRLLDAHPAVGRFEEQPLVITYLLDGEEREHYPDVRVEVAGAKELWEVKTLADAQDPEIARRTELMIKGLPTFGYRYRMVIGEDLGAAPRLKNALDVLRHGRKDIPLAERERLRRLLTSGQSWTWGEVLSGALGPKGKAYVCRLMLEGVLRFDMEKPLCNATAIAMASPIQQQPGVQS